MTEQTPTDHAAGAPPGQSTHRFASADPSGPSGHDTGSRSPHGGGFTAGVLVAALVVGGLGGVAGAAGLATFDSQSAGTAPPVSAYTDTRSSPASDVNVVDSQDTAPEPGSVEDVAGTLLPSVVQINVRSPQGSGSGSGIVLSPDGDILTNNHVVDVASDGGEISVSFDDGSSARAEILGTDPLTDLAVIKAQAVSGLTPAPLNASDTLDVGEEVVAIGSPFGLEATVTSGIVSALDRPVSVGTSEPGSLDTTYPAVQTDAAINPGNSGGPLVNMSGKVVGVNSSIRTASSATSEAGSIGLGFAIPLDKVLPIVDQLRSGRTPTHARLGVSVLDATSETGLTAGARVRTIEDGSAADEAGLQSGDVVTKVDGELITGAASLVATTRGYRPAETITLSVVRGSDEELTLDVTLDSDEGEPTS